MIKLLFILLWSTFCFAEIDEIGKRKDLFNQKTDHFVKVIQTKQIDKKFLSELSLSIAPSLRGFYYMNSYSTNLSYRLFLNDKISFHLKYDYYFNPINQEGKDELSLFGRIPLELKYPPKQSYKVGLDWYPFYGKAVFFNQVVHFNFYLSMSLGKIELIEINEKPLLFSSSLGVVHWWSKRFNTRIELEGLHYRYFAPEFVEEINQEWNYKLGVSAGVLF